MADWSLNSGSNHETDHPVWTKLDLQILSNSDKRWREQPKVFVHFDDVLKRGIRCKDDKTIRHFYNVLLGIYKTAKICQIKKRYKQFDEFESEAFSKGKEYYK